MSNKEKSRNVEKKKVEIIETRDIKVEEDVPPNLLKDYRVVVHKKEEVES